MRSLDDSSRRNGLRVLVADDSALNRRLAQALLERLGHKVDCAADGLEAVRATETTAYDLILMDVQMPDLDGIAAAGKIRAAGIETPVVALTATIDEAEMARCRAAGMEEALQKPLTAESLDAVISHFFG